MSNTPTKARLLIDNEWSDFVVAAAMQLQSTVKAMQPGAERALQFANSKQGRDILEGLKRIMQAKEDAETLSDAIHSAADITEIQNILSTVQLDAMTLLSLITVERSKEASQIELAAAVEEREAHRKRSLKGGNTRIANDKDGKQAARREAFGYFTKYEYKGPSAFAKAMLDKFGDVLDSQPVIERWYRDWKKGKNFPKNI
jgi:hypothetical protein